MRHSAQPISHKSIHLSVHSARFHPSISRSSIQLSTHLLYASIIPSFYSSILSIHLILLPVHSSLHPVILSGCAVFTLTYAALAAAGVQSTLAFSSDTAADCVTVVRFYTEEVRWSYCVPLTKPNLFTDYKTVELFFIYFFLPHIPKSKHFSCWFFFLLHWVLFTIPCCTLDCFWILSVIHSFKTTQAHHLLSY